MLDIFLPYGIGNTRNVKYTDILIDAIKMSVFINFVFILFGNIVFLFLMESGTVGEFGSSNYFLYNIVFPVITFNMLYAVLQIYTGIMNERISNKENDMQNKDFDILYATCSYTMAAISITIVSLILVTY